MSSVPEIFKSIRVNFADNVGNGVIYIYKAMDVFTIQTVIGERGVCEHFGADFYESIQNAPLLAAGMNGKVENWLDAKFWLNLCRDDGLNVRQTDLVVVNAPLLAAGFFTQGHHS